MSAITALDATRESCQRRTETSFVVQEFQQQTVPTGVELDWYAKGETIGEFAVSLCARPIPLRIHLMRIHVNRIRTPRCKHNDTLLRVRHVQPGLRENRPCGWIIQAKRLTVINDMAVGSVPSRVFLNEPPFQPVLGMPGKGLVLLVYGQPANNSPRVTSIVSLQVDFLLWGILLLQAQIIWIGKGPYDIPFPQGPV